MQSHRTQKFIRLGKTLLQFTTIQVMVQVLGLPAQPLALGQNAEGAIRVLHNRECAALDCPGDFR